MKTVLLKDNPEIKRIILAGFPSYRKLKAFVSDFHPGMNINSYWDGGSRDEYAIVHIPTLQRRALPTSSHPYFDVAAKGVCNTENADVACDHVGNVTLKRLPVDFALVRAGIFCGKPATAHVYYGVNLQPELPEGK